MPWARESITLGSATTLEPTLAHSMGKEEQHRLVTFAGRAVGGSVGCPGVTHAAVAIPSRPANDGTSLSGVQVTQRPFRDSEAPTRSTSWAGALVAIAAIIPTWSCSARRPAGSHTPPLN